MVVHFLISCFSLYSVIASLSWIGEQPSLIIPLDWYRDQDQEKSKKEACYWIIVIAGATDRSIFFGTLSFDCNNQIDYKKIHNLKYMKLLLIICLICLIVASEVHDANLKSKSSSTGTTKTKSKSKSSSSHYGDFSPFAAFLIGILLIGFTVPFLWYNERREAITEFRLGQAKQICETLDGHNDPPTLKSQLAHLVGTCSASEAISDDKFGVTLSDSIKLERIVEMYQWVRKSKQKDDKIKYYYEEEWKAEFQDTENEDYQNDRANWVVDKQTIINPQIFLGKFEIGKQLKQRADFYSEVNLSDQHSQTALANFTNGPHRSVQLENNMIYLKQNPNITTLGDVRVKFRHTPCGQVTIVAGLNDKVLRPWLIHDKYDSEEEMQNLGQYDDDQNASKQPLIQSDEENKGCLQMVKSLQKPITEIDWIQAGRYSKDEIFNLILDKNSKLTTIYRIVGFILIWIGFMLFFSPISTILSLFPLLGKFLAAVSGFIFALASFALSLAVSLTTIAIAWVFYHPVKGAILFLVSLIVFAGFYIMIASHDSNVPFEVEQNQ